MSPFGHYDPHNAFAKMLRGEIRCHRVHEGVLAFLDAFPQFQDHMLVIPKRSRARNLLELEQDAMAPLFGCAKMLMAIVVAVLAALALRLKARVDDMVYGGSWPCGRERWSRFCRDIGFNSLLASKVRTLRCQLSIVRLNIEKRLMTRAGSHEISRWNHRRRC